MAQSSIVTSTKDGLESENHGSVGISVRRRQAAPSHPTIPTAVVGCRERETRTNQAFFQINAVDRVHILL